MTIRHLKVFISVAENGSMTRAAEALHVAQPAVSYTISEIEKYYGIKLFERINQRLIITEFGKEMLRCARDAVASFDEFEKRARQSTEKASVKIGASITIGKTLIPKILEDIRLTFPEASPFVSINSTATIAEQVASGEIDFALVEGAVHSDNLLSVELSGDRLVAVASKNLNIPSKIFARELLNFPLLLRERGSASRELVDKLFLEFTLSAKPFIESSSNEALISAAKNGLGIAILPSVLLVAARDAGELSEIDIKDARFERKYYLIKHKSKKLGQTEEKIYKKLSEEKWENHASVLT